MPNIKITLNDGTTKTVKFDDGFTEADIEEVANQLNANLKPQEKGIDLTPSNLYKNYRAALEAPSRQTQERYVNNNKISLKDAYKLNRADQETSKLNKVLSPTIDIGSTLLLPEAKIAQGASLLPKLANYGATGAYQGGLIGGISSLKEDASLPNVVKGIVQGADIGLGIGVGLPLVGRVAVQGLKLLPMAGGFASRVLGRVQPETLQQAVKPNSKALDLSREQAQNLLMDTTERVQNTYDDLLRQRGQEVGEVAKGLNNTGTRLNVEDLAGDITETFNKYQGDVVNPARNMTGTLEDDLVDLVMQSADEVGTISPVDVNKLKQQVGHMTNWSDAVANNYQNPILEQVYGKWGNRLNELSPKLAQANKEFAQLRNFQKNEGLKRILKPGDNIDTASSALRNYNNTVTKGNTNRNIQDLEKLFVKEGKQPFLNDIDDVNAAMDLLNARGTGDSWLANIATQMTRPVLKLARAYNRSNLPAIYQKLGLEIPKGLTPVLYGGVEFNK